MKLPGMPRSKNLEGLLSVAIEDEQTKNLTDRKLIDGMRYSSMGRLRFFRDQKSNGDWGNVDEHLFYQGITPTNMPSSGQARYEGNSYLFSYGPKYGDRTYHDTQGAAHFDVDFGAKTIAGKLDNKVQLDPNNRNSMKEGFTFNGTIKGSNFEAKEEQDKIYYNGGFFGPNAEELGGVMRHDNDKVHGFFGAHKQ